MMNLNRRQFGFGIFGAIGTACAWALGVKPKKEENETKKSYITVFCSESSYARTASNCVYWKDEKVVLVDMDGNESIGSVVKKYDNGLIEAKVPVVEYTIVRPKTKSKWSIK